QDQRHHAKDGLRSGDSSRPAGRDHSFAERVKRAGANVAINDADAADQESLEPGSGMSVAMPISRRGLRGGSYNIAGHGSWGLKMLHCTISKARRLIILRSGHNLP